MEQLFQDKKLFTVREASSASSIGTTSIYSAIRRGELVAKKFGTKTLITAESLEQWIDSLPIKGGANV